MSMQNRTYTSFLLNYVEPTLISGVLKTTFYTELNTNVNVGDKVYILNGNYDNNSIFLLLTFLSLLLQNQTLSFLLSPRLQNSSGSQKPSTPQCPFTE